jgi:hypothetical protein
MALTHDALMMPFLWHVFFLQNLRFNICSPDVSSGEVCVLIGGYTVLCGLDVLGLPILNIATPSSTASWPRAICCVAIAM